MAGIQILDWLFTRATSSIFENMNIQNRVCQYQNISKKICDCGGRKGYQNPDENIYRSGRGEDYGSGIIPGP